ncbi:MAG TPA: FAD-dependent tricarballylate dehydrogenase TcuA [Candidatus Tectomicrobia bacterium]|nr:FAD-dependent tricarballylate dehydrogenase TcuA [Candidatus Tectomicrobia bacterium]
MEESELFSEVVVVGAGNAALTAALSAREAGAQVLVLEKAPHDDRGGNSRFTGGIVRFAHAGLEDIIPLVPDLSEGEIGRLEVEPYPAAAYVADIMRLSEGKADQALTHVLVHNSYQTVQWMQSLGVQFELYQTAVRQEGRIYFPAGAVIQFWSGGPGLTHRLFRAAEGRGIDVIYDAKVIDLLTTAGRRVQGVRVQSSEGLMDMRAGAVILACGGFEASDERRARYLGAEWEKVHVRGTRHNTGELLDCLEALGAQLGGHLDGAHAVPVDAGSPEVGDLNLGDLTARLSYPLGIMVNRDAQRFIDEGMDFKSYSYTVMGPAILRQPDGMAYQIFDQQTVERLEARYGSGSPPATADTVEALAEKLGLNPQTLVRTVNAYNDAVREGTFNPAKKDGKRTQGIEPPKTNWALRLDKPPFVAYGVRCGITFTYGGVMVDEAAEVLHRDGAPIPGLYAAGEITGGIFYHNYPSGSGLMLGAVFGRIAGTKAAAFAR